MKNLFFFVIFISAIFFTSCSEDELDVELQTTLSQDLDVIATSGSDRMDGHKSAITDSEYPFSKSAILSLDNEDTHQYLNKIKNVKIKRLTYRVEDYGTSHGTLSAILYADEREIHRVEDLLARDDAGEAIVFEIVDVDGKISQMESALLNNKNLTLTITGNRSCSCSMTFKVRVTADVEAIANPL